MLFIQVIVPQIPDIRCDSSHFAVRTFSLSSSNVGCNNVKRMVGGGKFERALGWLTGGTNSGCLG